MACARRIECEWLWSNRACTLFIPLSLSFARNHLYTHTHIVCICCTCTWDTAYWLTLVNMSGRACILSSTRAIGTWCAMHTASEIAKPILGINIRLDPLLANAGVYAFSNIPRGASSLVWGTVVMPTTPVLYTNAELSALPPLTIQQMKMDLS